MCASMNYMSEHSVTDQHNEELYGQLRQLADKRMSATERDLFAVAEFDPNNEYHDLRQNIFSTTTNLPPSFIAGMAEAVLHGYDTTAFPAASTVQHDRVRHELKDSLENATERLAEGRRLMVLTAHQTRLEPAVVAYLTQAALAEDDQQHNDLRTRSTIFISRYLACLNIDASKLAGLKEPLPMNVVQLSRELGAVALSFPNTPNMRQLSGIDRQFQGAYNRELVKKIHALPAGSICFMAASGTMDIYEEGSYRIPAVKHGTLGLVQSGWDVVPIASVLDGDNPFSVAGEIVPAESVNEARVHGMMEWIARTRSQRHAETHYDVSG